MSNRKKVKPEKLGRTRVDIYWPEVTDAEDVGPASVRAVIALRQNAGPWFTGRPDCLLWRGKRKVLEVLQSLKDAGHVPADARHLEMVGRAHELGEEAVLVLARGKMLAAGARAAEAELVTTAEGTDS